VKEFFQPVVEEKKKKKVRLEEKVYEEKPKVEELEEGFKVVGKPKPKQRFVQSEENENEDKPKETHQKIKTNVESNNRPKKRQFERQSGTGRGKEISKQGAGGKGTWGTNTKNLVKEQNNNNDYGDNTEDKYFHYALKPKEEKTKVEEEPKQEPIPEIEAKLEEKEQEYVEGTETENRKKKNVLQPVVNKEDLLERPENALSVSEYKEQLKLKTQHLYQPTKEIKQVDSNLQIQSKNEILEIGTSQQKQVKAPKTKKNRTTK